MVKTTRIIAQAENRSGQNDSLVVNVIQEKIGSRTGWPRKLVKRVAITKTNAGAYMRTGKIREVELRFLSVQRQVKWNVNAGKKMNGIERIWFQSAAFSYETDE